MKNTNSILKFFIASLIIFSTLILSIHALNIFPEKHDLFKMLIFTSAAITSLFFVIKKDINHLFDFMSITLIYNPFFAPPMGFIIWQIIDLIVILLNITNIYVVLKFDEIKEIERIAKAIHDHFKTIEHEISAQSYHQATLLIHRKYPNEAVITDEHIKWNISEIPNFEFIITPEFFEGNTNKGGISAIGLNQYSNLELKCNFNLPPQVKFTLMMKGKLITRFNPSCIQLKQILKQKYRYLDSL